MTPVAIVFLVLSTVILWGGFIVSTVFLAKQPEIAEYPPGGDEADAADG